MSLSRLAELMPDECVDVHVLRTLGENLVDLLYSFQQRIDPQRLARVNDILVEITCALHFLVREVEEQWEIWRNESVLATLREGFAHISRRIWAAAWRRAQGQPSSPFILFPSLSPDYRLVRTAPHTASNNTAPGGAPASGPAAQLRPSSSASMSSNVHHESWSHSSTSYIPQNGAVPVHHEWPAAPPAHAQPGYPGHARAPPPPHRPQPMPPPAAREGPARGPAPARQHHAPPPRAPDSVVSLPGAPNAPPEVAAAVEVAVRFLETVHKAVDILIEFRAL
ncbi:hypothetical protein BC834DRAFT_972662 [Gloeopeniophorella convolvens]|nr:hypothetical protein BC834DRAFT_972662 [Gloeopeniophorella convolvens]